jgi:hypothetical protein
VPDRVQSTCSIQLLSLCKFPWPPFPSLQSQVLVLLVHGPAILCCLWCASQVHCPRSAYRMVFN